METAVIAPEALEDLVVAAEGGRLPRGRPDRDGRRNRLRGARLRERAADRLDGHAGARKLPARAARRRGQIRLCGRARIPGSSSCCRRTFGSGRQTATTAASRSPRSPSRTGRSRSSASAPASCTRSRSRIESSSGGGSATATTPRAGKAPSSSPPTATSRAAPASAARWAPVRRWSRDTTWR